MPNLNTTTLASAIKTEYERRLLTRALPRLVHGRWSTLARLNKFGSYELRRYESLSTVTSALGEGATPAEQGAPALTVITVTPSWYGAWIGHSDILDMVAFDPIIMETSSILGEQCGLSADTIVRNALTDGATKDYSGGAAGRTSLAVNTHLLSYADFVRQIAALEAANALPLEGDNFVCVIHPYDWATIMQDPTFVNLFYEEAESNAAGNAMRSGYVGKILRTNIYVTSNARSYADGGASNADPYSMLFIGREAFGTVGIANTTPDVVDRGGDGYANNTGMQVKPVEIIVKPVGSSGALDPLNQRGSIGWKMSLAIQVLQSAWIRDLEHINAFS